MEKLIITISREFGSGGRLIAERLAKNLGILFYDRALIEMAAKKSGLNPDFIEKTEEQAENGFLYNLVSATYSASTMFVQYDPPAKDRAFFAQAEVIRELAKGESCVIVGRCADYVLQDHPGLIKLFIYGPRDARIQFAVENYGISPADAAVSVAKIDKGRANYHQFYSGRPWGQLHNYDIAVNTTVCGIDAAVDGLTAMIKTMRGHT